VLKRLDQAWRLFTRFTEAQTVFDLVSRVTISPEGARVEINAEALIRLIGELAEHGDAMEGDAG
jgi:hypothetical protein